MTSMTTKAKTLNTSEEQASVPRKKGNKSKNSRRKKSNYKNKKGSNKNDRKKFVGKTEGMKGHVFQLKSESKNVLQFTKSQEQLVRWATSNCKRADDIKKMIKTLDDSVIEVPSKDTKILDDEVRQQVFTQKIKLYVEKTEVYADNKSKMWYHSPT